MKKVLKLAAEIYQDNEGCIKLMFNNPWRGEEKAVFAMLMWPGHEIDKTAEVEEAYEHTATFLANATIDYNLAMQKVENQTFNNVDDYLRAKYYEVLDKFYPLDDYHNGIAPPRGTLSVHIMALLRHVVARTQLASQEQITILKDKNAEMFSILTEISKGTGTQATLALEYLEKANNAQV